MKKLVLIFSVVLFQTVTALAYDSVGSVSAATGGTGVGTIEAVDGAFTNPASIALFPTKSFSLAYSKNNTAVTLADNGEDVLFAAALGYTQEDIDPLLTKVAHLAIAHTIYKKIALGVDVGFRELKLDSSDLKFRQTVGTAGLTAEITPWLTAGIVSKNYAFNDTDLPDTVDKNATVAVGFALVHEDFAKLRFDVESGPNQTTTKLKYKTGIETYINDWIITRIGYQNDNVNAMNFFTAGVGFSGPQFGLHYAYQSEAQSKVDTLHSVDLSVPF